MNSFSLGDLAQTFMLQRRGAALKADLGRITEELSTGQVSDVKSVLAGNTSYLSDLESDLQTLAGYRVATVEAGQFADATQSALERVNASVESLSAKYLAMSPHANGPVLDQFTAEAEAELATIVDALNTSSGGRSLFSGRATDQPALQGMETLLAELRAATVGATSTTDLKLAAETWFNDPSGFAALVYNGTDETLAPFRLGGDETVGLNLTANSQALRDVLMHVSIAAISGDISYGLSSDNRQALLQETGQTLFQAQSALTSTRASVGSSQAQIEVVAARNSAEEFSLLSAKSALLQVDPYEAATELEAVQFQLQSLYTITARMSDMSFVNYIR
ncbi:flagellin [uncultured Tateyamaria sp.]|uniref:flagellin n=1 Tax=uncultured Tateyamaria sp. TaxID=455651 RepID=UPI002624C796|nr:flagellin [uncultured Tateyamaria sp.]